MDCNYIALVCAAARIKNAKWPSLTHQKCEIIMIPSIVPLGSLLSLSPCFMSLPAIDAHSWHSACSNDNKAERCVLSMLWLN